MASVLKLLVDVRVHATLGVKAVPHVFLAHRAGDERCPYLRWRCVGPASVRVVLCGVFLQKEVMQDRDGVENVTHLSVQEHAFGVVDVAAMRHINAGFHCKALAKFTDEGPVS